MKWEGTDWFSDMKEILLSLSIADTKILLLAVCACPAAAGMVLDMSGAKPGEGQLACP